MPGIFKTFQPRWKEAHAGQPTRTESHKSKWLYRKENLARDLIKCAKEPVHLCPSDPESNS